MVLVEVFVPSVVLKTRSSPARLNVTCVIITFNNSGFHSLEAACRFYPQSLTIFHKFNDILELYQWLIGISHVLCDKETMNIYKVKEEYAKNRYLKDLSLPELEKRAIDIFSNILILDENCKISCLKVENGGGYWFAAFDDIAEEFRLRYGSWQSGFSSGFIQKAPVPDPKERLSKSSSALLKLTKKCHENTFFKLGKLRHMSDLYNFGKLRISPASYYDDPSLSSAIRDDELKFTIYPTGKPMPLRNYTPPASNIPDKIIHSIEAKCPTNYFVFCMAAEYSARLPADFCADAVLEISDMKKFSTLLAAAVFQELPEWRLGLNTVTYIDPLIPHVKNPIALFSKHFRYFYQKEVRYVWLPPRPQMELKPINIEMGSLTELCKLHVLET